MSTDTEVRRVAIFSVSWHLLKSLLALPDDVRLLAARDEFVLDEVQFKIESATLPVTVNPGEPVPQVVPHIRRNVRTGEVEFVGWQ